MKSRISYTKPSITALEVHYASDAAANGWGDKCYEYIDRFEELFKEHLSVKYAVATSSCTGALHLGMRALNIGPDDEVILADTNWIATVSPVVSLGAKPVFVDILQKSWCIDPRKAEAAITPKTKAIVATHIYGNLCDMNALTAIAEQHGIAIIEDSAEAIGSVYYGQKAGSIGAFASFSFHGTKTVTTGEGGMFVTSDPQLFETVLTLSNHGRSRSQSKQFWPDMVGYKYKMSNVQAAIGCAQLERIDELVTRKREIFRKYKSNLSKLHRVTFNPEPAGTVNGAWMPTLVFDQASNINRETLLNAFAEADIDARVFFYPLSSLGMFESVLQNRFAWDIPERAINLPSYHDMSNNDIDRVCDVVIDLMRST